MQNGSFNNFVVPDFPNLINLDIDFDEETNWHLVLDLLKNSPKLQVFELCCFTNSGKMDFSADPNFVPGCLTSHFRKCVLRFCNDKENGIRFAKYIMQNSTTLQSMTFCSWKGLSKQEKNELSSVSRSAMCELSIT